MTRKEAAGVIKFEKACVLRQDTPRCNRDCKKCDLLLPTEDVLTAYDMAIKALEQQPCEDTISRQAAIDALGEKPLAWTEGEYELGLQNQWQSDVDALNGLPSAQPEQRWIPCSKKMPDEHEWLGTKKFETTISNEVYVTFEAPDGQRFAKHISFQNGKLSPVDEQRMKVLFKGAKPIAWMPLPEPWKGDTRE